MTYEIQEDLEKEIKSLKLHEHINNFIMFILVVGFIAHIIPPTNYFGAVTSVMWMGLCWQLKISDRYLQRRIVY
jgi:hypothetical protein